MSCSPYLTRLELVHLNMLFKNSLEKEIFDSLVSSIQAADTVYFRAVRVGILIFNYHLPVFIISL